MLGFGAVAAAAPQILVRGTAASAPVSLSPRVRARVRAFATGIAQAMVVNRASCADESRKGKDIFEKLVDSALDLHKKAVDLLEDQTQQVSPRGLLQPFFGGSV